MKKYTNNQKIAGELACRSLSDLALRFYTGTDPLKVYEYETDEGKRYAYEGCIGNNENLTFEELDEIFSDWQKEIEEEDENVEYTEWYAIQKDKDDNDWGTGSFNKEEAIEMAHKRGYKYIATISGEWDIDGDPITEGICVEVEEV